MDNMGGYTWNILPLCCFLLSAFFQCLNASNCLVKKRKSVGVFQFACNSPHPSGLVTQLKKIKHCWAICLHYWVFSCSLIHKEWWMSFTSTLHPCSVPNRCYMFTYVQNTNPKHDKQRGFICEKCRTDDLFIPKANTACAVPLCLNMLFTSGSRNHRVLFRFLFFKLWQRNTSKCITWTLMLKYLENKDTAVNEKGWHLNHPISLVLAGFQSTRETENEGV